LGTDSFGVLITALSANSKSNMLSTPSLLTLDHQKAEILVGQNVPFQTGSFTTSGSGADNPFTTIERKDIGVTLKVTPHINDGCQPAPGNRTGNLLHRADQPGRQCRGFDHQQTLDQKHHPR
jgi:type II secretory pathway component HofQ